MKISSSSTTVLAGWVWLMLVKIPMAHSSLLQLWKRPGWMVNMLYLEKCLKAWYVTLKLYVLSNLSNIMWQTEELLEFWFALVPSLQLHFVDYSAWKQCQGAGLLEVAGSSPSLTINLFTPVPPVTAHDEPWPFFHFWRHHFRPKWASSRLNFCRKKRSFQWCLDQSDWPNGAWDMSKKAKKDEWKTRRKISCHYT